MRVLPDKCVACGTNVVGDCVDGVCYVYCPKCLLKSSYHSIFYQGTVNAVPFFLCRSLNFFSFFWHFLHTFATNIGKTTNGQTAHT